MSSLEKANGEILVSKFSRILLKDPYFMFLCPDLKGRAKFISKYFSYYINIWQKNGELFFSKSKNAAATLIDSTAYKFSFKGKKGLSLKISKYSRNILIHRETVQRISEIILPEQTKRRVMTIYAAPQAENADIAELIAQSKAKAEKEGFAVLYETLSRRLVPEFEKSGFETVYAKQFIGTQYFQTVMAYNIK